MTQPDMASAGSTRHVLHQSQGGTGIRLYSAQQSYESKYDRVFDASSTQEAVYGHVAGESITGIMRCCADQVDHLVMNYQSLA